MSEFIRVYHEGRHTIRITINHMGVRIEAFNHNGSIGVFGLLPSEMLQLAVNGNITYGSITDDLSE